jgi:hypothetical protein
MPHPHRRISRAENTCQIGLTCSTRLRGNLFVGAVRKIGAEAGRRHHWARVGAGVSESHERRMPSILPPRASGSLTCGTQNTRQLATLRFPRRASTRTSDRDRGRTAGLVRSKGFTSAWTRLARSWPRWIDSPARRAARQLPSVCPSSHRSLGERTDLSLGVGYPATELRAMPRCWHVPAPFGEAVFQAAGAYAVCA